jgi:glycosyltransferase involved in cell wall biosynthesis
MTKMRKNRDFDIPDGKVLIVLVRHYPYEAGEEYFDSEMQVLFEQLKQVICVTSAKTFNGSHVYPEGLNVIIVNRRYQLFCSLILGVADLFRSFSWREWVGLIQNRRTSPLTALIGLMRYHIVARRTMLWCKANQIHCKPDATLYSYWLDPVAYALARLRLKGGMFRAVARGHGSDVLCDPFFRQYMADGLDYILFSAEKIKDFFAAQTNIDFSKLMVYRLGVFGNPTDKNPAPDGKTAFHVVSCSSAIAVKRLDLIVDALRHCTRSIRWTHIGGGALLEQAMELAQQYGLKADFTGTLSNQEVHRFYKTIPVDLLLNASDSEGVPVSVMEALSHGIPVLARNVGGMSEIVFDGENGRLVSADCCAEDIAFAIDSFPSGKAALRMRESAQTLWNRMYNARKNYGALVEFFRGKESK